MKLSNPQPKILPDNEEVSRKRQIITETLEFDEQRIRRFIRISLASMKIFGLREELEEHAEEVFQQTAVSALEKAEVYDSNRSTFSWLNGFAANAVKQMRSRVLRQREKFEDGFADVERIEMLRRKIETTALPEEQFWEKSERAEEGEIRFERLISKLTGDYQKILRLHYFEELNIIEIAAGLGKSESAAQRQLNRAENKLRKILSDERETK